MPTVTIRVSLDEGAGGGTRMTIETTFPSSDAMSRLISTGFEAGMATAVGQVDDVLRADVGPA